MREMIDIFIIINFVVLGIHYIKTKNVMNISYIIQFFILFNIFLYFRKWSLYIQDEPTLSFYIVSLSIIFIFFIGLLFSKKINYNKVSQIEYINYNAVIAFNFIYLVLVILESYIATGSIAPSLCGIDSHTLSIPGINIITRNLGLVLVLNTISLKYNKKCLLILLSIFHIIYFFIFRSARIIVITGIIQLVIFSFIYYYKYINLKKVSFTMISIGLTIIIGVMIGNNRMNHFGKYDIKYSDGILYTGPNDPIDLMAVYYGYFPMSFENLNLSMKKVQENNAWTYGLNTMAPINVGLLKLNKIDNYPYVEYVNENTDYHIDAAIVATGFLEFYMDFGNLLVISLIIYMAITIYFYNRIRKDIIYIYIYSTLASCWAMMSFQNLLIVPNTLYQIILFFIFRKVFIRKNGKSIVNNID